MENMTAQVSSPLLHRYEAAAFGTGTTAATSTANPFDAIIQSMIAQMMEDSPDETAESLLTQAFGNSQKDDPLLSASSAMMNVLPSNMLSLLTANALSPTGELSPETLSMIGRLSLGTQSMTSGLSTETLSMGSGLSAETLSMMSALSQGTLSTGSNLTQQTLISALTGQQNSLLSQTLSQSTLSQNTGTYSALQSESPATAALLTGIPIAEASSSSSSGSGSEESFSQLMDFQQNFQQAIQSVKQQLKAKPEDTTAEPLSVDQLQGSTRLTNVQELMAQKTEATSEIPLTDQLTQGIREHLDLGDSEFTLKLKPESLGEISIKLVKAGGKLTLDITAASSQTARLINSDLSALQQAVKPMQVEVHEAMTSHAGQNDAQQYNMAGQQFGGNAQQYSSGRSSTPYYAATESSHAEESTQPAAQQTADPTSQLSVYI